MKQNYVKFILHLMSVDIDNHRFVFCFKKLKYCKTGGVTFPVFIHSFH